MTGPAAGGPNLDDLGSFTTTVQAGEFVFREGDAEKRTVYVLSGTVELREGTRTLARSSIVLQIHCVQTLSRNRRSSNSIEPRS
mgnify:CR=1 FL=1